MPFTITMEEILVEKNFIKKGDKYLSINENVLDWLGYQGSYRNQKRSVRILLKKHRFKFTNTSPNNQGRTFFSVSVNDFGKLIHLMRTNNVKTFLNNFYKKKTKSTKRIKEKTISLYYICQNLWYINDGEYSHEELIVHFPTAQIVRKWDNIKQCINMANIINKYYYLKLRWNAYNNLIQQKYLHINETIMSDELADNIQKELYHKGIFIQSFVFFIVISFIFL
ncbi:hypothetical protein GpSGHVEth173 [Glossina pallidipes salivary gland hypertrophy virus]|uniref:MSV199 domain-containing protein n=1 Tax=Glossina hytrovirus (isolate Glossina pallidipes/Ethiopia/Seibersdorf/-) TaxID=379529 RepID=A0A110AQ80_GHVS|nr:hypothetical protein GpSGHVEth173 [Glossina pallidipes salivary gland hypertrophy virus]